MSKLPVPLVFDWDKSNIDKNWEKHRVRYKEAEEVFFNKPLRIFPDKKHLGTEKRFVAFGATNKRRKLTIIFTIRVELIRIISARDQSRKERRQCVKEN